LSSEPTASPSNRPSRDPSRSGSQSSLSSFTTVWTANHRRGRRESRVTESHSKASGWSLERRPRAPEHWVNLGPRRLHVLLPRNSARSAVSTACGSWLAAAWENLTGWGGRVSRPAGYGPRASLISGRAALCAAQASLQAADRARRSRWSRS
jgi:hypothetical protein